LVDAGTHEAGAVSPAGLAWDAKAEPVQSAAIPKATSEATSTLLIIGFPVVALQRI
jgi:hypothetical protein